MALLPFGTTGGVKGDSGKLDAHLEKIGRDERIRTSDPLNPIQVTPLFHIISPEFRVFHN